jgi:hypothetical protein
MPFTLWFMWTDLRLHRITHFGDSSAALLPREIWQEEIPAALGGTWNDFGNWTRLRLQLELERGRNDHR